MLYTKPGDNFTQSFKCTWLDCDPCVTWGNTQMFLLVTSQWCTLIQILKCFWISQISMFRLHWFNFWTSRNSQGWCTPIPEGPVQAGLELSLLQQGCELFRPETVRACAGGTPGLFIEVKLKAEMSGVIIRMYADWQEIYKQMAVPFVWTLSRRIRQSQARAHPDLTLP